MRRAPHESARARETGGCRPRRGEWRAQLQPNARSIANGAFDDRIPGFGFGLFRRGETWNRSFQPVAVFHRRPIALLAAAVLPGTGRDAAFRLADKMTSAGFAVTDSTGQLAATSLSSTSPSSLPCTWSS
jgi:hypothetical protein